MPRAQLKDIELEYSLQGPTSGPPVLLIMGIGQQMLAWPQPLLQALTEAGLFTVRYDSRDTGLSTHLDSYKPPSMMQVLAMGREGANVAPYTLHDMADDAAGLLDHLGIESAHIVGVSMGGMVAQLVAARHAHRTKSLISIMSTTSEGDLPGPTEAAMQGLLLRPQTRSEQAVVEHGVMLRQVLGSPGYPADDAYWAEMTRAAYRRDYSPAGFVRHLMAVTVSGHRRAELAAVTAPTLVIHGADDPLVPAACGERTAALIADSELQIIEGMGHDLPPALCALLAERISAHVRRHA